MGKEQQKAPLLDPELELLVKTATAIRAFYSADLGEVGSLGHRHLNDEIAHEAWVLIKACKRRLYVAECEEEKRTLYAEIADAQKEERLTWAEGIAKINGSSHATRGGGVRRLREVLDKRPIFRRNNEESTENLMKTYKELGFSLFEVNGLIRWQNKLVQRGELSGKILPEVENSSCKPVSDKTLPKADKLGKKTDSATRKR